MAADADISPEWQTERPRRARVERRRMEALFAWRLVTECGRETTMAGFAFVQPSRNPCSVVLFLYARLESIAPSVVGQEIKTETVALYLGFHLSLQICKARFQSRSRIKLKMVAKYFRKSRSDNISSNDLPNFKIPRGNLDPPGLPQMYDFKFQSMRFHWPNNVYSIG